MWRRRIGVGRSKLLNLQSKRFKMKSTNSKLKKIEKISKKLKISKYEMFLRGIDLLERDKLKRYKSFAKNPGQNEPGVVRENSDDD